MKKESTINKNKLRELISRGFKPQTLLKKVAKKCNVSLRTVYKTIEDDSLADNHNIRNEYEGHYEKLNKALTKLGY